MLASTSCSRACSAQVPSHRHTPRSSGCRRTTIRTYALFGWGKKAEDKQPDPNDWRAIEREDQLRVQKEMLARRKSGAYVTEANERRRKVKETVEEKKAARKKERKELGEGVMPQAYRDWQPYDKETRERDGSGIVVPLLPFGLRKFDEGERFDLRSPYSDDGWVDPEETDMWAGLKKLGTKVLDFSNGQALREQSGKPIIWASDYQRYLQEKKGKPPGPPDGKAAGGKAGGKK